MRTREILDHLNEIVPALRGVQARGVGLAGAQIGAELEGLLPMVRALASLQRLPLGPTVERLRVFVESHSLAMEAREKVRAPSELWSEFNTRLAALIHAVASVQETLLGVIPPTVPGMFAIQLPDVGDSFESLESDIELLAVAMEQPVIRLFNVGIRIVGVDRGSKYLEVVLDPRSAAFVMALVGLWYKFRTERATRQKEILENEKLMAEIEKARAESKTELAEEEVLKEKLQVLRYGSQYAQLKLDQLRRQMAQDIADAAAVDDEVRARVSPEVVSWIETSIDRGATALDRGVEVVDARHPNEFRVSARALHATQPLLLGPRSDPED